MKPGKQEVGEGTRRDWESFKVQGNLVKNCGASNWEEILKYWALHLKQLNFPPSPNLEIEKVIIIVEVFTGLG